jgi:hypothetical protein
VLANTRPAGEELNVPPNCVTFGVVRPEPVQYEDCAYANVAFAAGKTVTPNENVPGQEPDVV